MLFDILYVMLIAAIVVNTYTMTFTKSVNIGSFELTVNWDWTVLSMKNWKFSSNDIYLPVVMFKKTSGAWAAGIPMLYVTSRHFNK